MSEYNYNNYSVKYLHDLVRNKPIAVGIICNIYQAPTLSEIGYAEFRLLVRDWKNKYVVYNNKAFDNFILSLNKHISNKYDKIIKEEAAKHNKIVLHFQKTVLPSFINALAQRKKQPIKRK